MNKFKAGDIVMVVDVDMLVAGCIGQARSELIASQPFEIFSVYDSHGADRDNVFYHGAVDSEAFGFRIPIKALKPVVHYKGAGLIVEGRQAYVVAIDHYSHLIDEGEVVTTSRVLKFDADSGRFETRNTVYVPAYTVSKFLKKVAA